VSENKKDEEMRPHYDFAGAPRGKYGPHYRMTLLHVVDVTPEDREDSRVGKPVDKERTE
jgi:hypothetical protein